MTSASTEDVIIASPNPAPDPTKAAIHAEEFTLHDSRGQPFKICDSTPVDLGTGGIGIEMYFVYLKQMVILFGVMSVISLPVVVINYLGGYLNSVDKTSPFEASTIANQKGIPPGITNKEDAQSAIEEHKAYMYTTVITDFIYCVVYLAFIFIFQRYNKRRVNKSKNVSVRSFAIMVDLEAGANVTETELKKFFERYGSIHECRIPKYYGKTLRRFIKYTQIEKAIIVEECKPPDKEDPKVIDNFKAKRVHILSQIENKSTECGKVRAFIIFESIKARQDCLKDYIKWNSLKNSQDQPQRLRFENTLIAVKKAPEPGEIFWENFGDKKSNWKLAIVYMILAFAMLISLLLISIVEYYENRLPTYARCLEFDDPKITNATSSLQKTDEEVICFCGGLAEDQIENNPDYAEFCKNYWQNFYVIWIIRLAGLSGVALINMIIKYVVMGAGKMGKFTNNTAEEMSKLISYFLSQTFNICLIIMIANLDLTDLSFISYIQNNIPGGKYFFKGLHPNFTRFWYVKVGMAILVLKTIGIIWPQILSIAFMVPVCTLKRILFAHKQSFQRDMDKCYEKLNINLWDRYGSNMANAFFALMFCSGIPLLLPLQALFHLLQYWIDKTLCNLITNANKSIVVKFSRRPPPYGMQLNKEVFRIMPLGMCCHMICAIFVYTSNQIYPLSVDETIAADGITFYEGTNLSIFSRVFSRFGLPFFIGAIGICAYVILRPVVKSIWRKSCCYDYSKHKDEHETGFTALKENFKMNCIVTYDIWSNPEYLEVLQQVSHKIKI